MEAFLVFVRVYKGFLMITAMWVEAVIVDGITYPIRAVRFNNDLSSAFKSCDFEGLKPYTLCSVLTTPKSMI